MQGANNEEIDNERTETHAIPMLRPSLGERPIVTQRDRVRPVNSLRVPK